MRRTKTQITVWPAIADLMTVTAIIAITFGVAGGGCDGENETGEKISAFEADSLREDNDSLRTALEEKNGEIKELEARRREDMAALEARNDSLRIMIMTNPVSGSCFGKVGNQPKAVATIRMLPAGIYRVSRTWNSQESMMVPTASAFFDRTNSVEMDKEKLHSFHAALKQDEKLSEMNRCSWFVRLDTGGLGADEIRDRWHDDIRNYFPLTNPPVVP